MCDYSLTHVLSRPAKVGDKLRVHSFGSTIGFGDPDPTLQAPVAVCVLPGAEIAFDAPIKRKSFMAAVLPATTEELPAEAKFAQVNKDEERTHHDALEFADGRMILLNDLEPGQTASVLQLPPAPKTEAEAQEQKHAEYIG